MSQKTNSDKLAPRVAEAIKTAHEIIQEQKTKLAEASSSVEDFTADKVAAEVLIDQIIDKLSSTRVDGEYLVQPELKEDYRAAMESKEGMAKLLDQLVDIVQTQNGSSKSASLGEPASADFSPEPELAGFGSLRSSNIRM